MKGGRRGVAAKGRGGEEEEFIVDISMGNHNSRASERRAACRLYEHLPRWNFILAVTT